jgi:hypothetical protein
VSSSVVSLSASPRLHVVEQGRALESYGDLAGEFSASYGLIPDSWQQLVLDDWLAVDEFGLWSALTCGLACPRQNGKNGILEIRELFGMVGRGEKILHTAHEVKTARKAFKRLQFFFGREVKDRACRFPELNERVVELRNVNGQEAIYLDNGGSVEIVARSKNSGRGFTADVLVMDEAQEMSDEDLEALMPTTSAAPLGNPQWIFTGTPPGPKANGEVFTRTREDALSESPYRLVWHEWSACDPDDLEGIDLDDRDVWHATNPALGGRLQIAVVEGERSRFSDGGFARERLGVWAKPKTEAKDWLVFDEHDWFECRHPESQADGLLGWSVDVSPESRSAAISCSDGTHGEVVEYRAGTDWVVARLLELRAKHGFDQVALDANGPAGALLNALDQAGIEVRKVTITEHAQACGDLLAHVRDHTFVHIGQEPLDAAAAGAAKRTIVDVWLWTRSKAGADICPLVAVTLARWFALTLRDDGDADFFTI